MNDGINALMAQYAFPLDMDEVCVSFFPAVDQSLLHLLVDNRRMTLSAGSFTEPSRFFGLDEHEVALGR
ncbi:MAG: hypothetical protein Q7U98_09380 [Methylicorpusculum sp.]|uniref:hypothetical protein n=1 Tax=Methylicorpusculum sp. TaxID=2713644 RepID=UPI002717D3CF|nr:hypothetical protein [Methylicorpusculum sp.]MDO8843891.1 hypothetical protein [Methylicorpusculum sp.]MDO8939361.1 hypothetical protein [Methylicorpusculum sp.]MDP2179938.1 hypothetical protein [Methylicorpusculum sp.]MDP2203352.1 hypothetical protein [Methylicorpusculum sp.]MDP3530350.1 hypothetical protein [Methylicorpusculum sp.]